MHQNIVLLLQGILIKKGLSNLYRKYSKIICVAHMDVRFRNGLARNSRSTNTRPVRKI